MEEGPRRVPWVTLGVGLCAALVWFLPGRAQGLLEFDRERVLGGQFWRLLTGHLVHFSASHLAWNLLALCAVGAWAELSRFPGTGWLAVGAPLGVGLSLLMDPALARYGGLSGVVTAAAAFAATAEFRRHRGRARILWAGAMALVAAKLAWEWRTGASVFADFRGTGVGPAPVAHLSGFLVGIAAAALARTGSGQAD